MVRLLLAMFLPLLAVAQETVFEQAVTKGARIAGLWEASLDGAQAKLLDPDLGPDYLFLHIQVDIKQSQTDAVLAVSRVDLDSRFPSGGIHHQYSMLGNLESEHQGVLRFSATRKAPQQVAFIRVRPLEAERIEATLSIGNASTRIVFTRPVSAFESPFRGDWVGSFLDETDVFHVHSWSANQTLATYDRIGRDWAFLGMLFLPFGSTAGKLSLDLDSAFSIHQFQAVLVENSAALDGKWLGSGMLGAARFRRSSPFVFEDRR